MSTTVVSTTRYERIPLWEIRRIREAQKRLGFSWWQLGRVEWSYNDDFVKVRLVVLGLTPWKWRTTLAHEFGHVEIVEELAPLLDKGLPWSKVNAMMQDENDAYDRWNLHGLLWWRNKWRRDP